MMKIAFFPPFLKKLKKYFLSSYPLGVERFLSFWASAWPAAAPSGHHAWPPTGPAAAPDELPGGHRPVGEESRAVPSDTSSV